MMGASARVTGLASARPKLSSPSKKSDHHDKSAPSKEGPFRRRGCTPNCAMGHAHHLKEQAQKHTTSIQSHKIDHARRHATHRHETRKLEKNRHAHLHLLHDRAGKVSMTTAKTRSATKTSRALAALKKVLS